MVMLLLHLIVSPNLVPYQHSTGCIPTPYYLRCILHLCEPGVFTAKLHEGSVATEEDLTIMFMGMMYRDEIAENYSLRSYRCHPVKD